MIYLDAIFCETIRIHSPVHQIFYRKVTGDHYLGQTLIKKGTIVTPFFFGLQYDPKNYENPFEFRP